MQSFRSIIFILFCFFGLGLSSLGLSGCATIKSARATFDPSKYDGYFVGYQDVELVAQSSIFHLNEPSKAYVRQRSEFAAKTHDKALTLINDLFSPSQLALDYVHGANTVAQDTYDSGKANCLSLTILAFAMAEEAGLSVKFYEVFQQESWSQLGDFDLANGHVNLKVSGAYRNNTLQGVPSIKRTYTVDFFPTVREGKFKTKEIDKQTIVSYFYSNLAAKALIDRDNLAAYANIRQSIRINPNDSSAWNNLALVLKRQELNELAVFAYEQAIHLRKDNFTAWENLAILLDKNGNGDINGDGFGDKKRAQEIRAKLDKQRKENPNFYIRLGNRFLVDGDLDSAEDAFKQSLRLNEKNHIAWFGLARVSADRGNIEGTKSNLAKARKFARESGFKRRYASKLAALSGTSY